MDDRDAFLRRFGADSETLAELLAYGENPYRGSYEKIDSGLPLEDEEHLEAWSDYAKEAEIEGIFEALARRLIQLRFPIEDGMAAKPR